MKSILMALCGAGVMFIFGAYHPAPGSVPVLSGIKPDTVFPGQIVLVEGTNLQNARVVWDETDNVFLQSQTVTNYFQIPHDAPLGLHNVKLTNADGSSEGSMQICVLPLKVSWPAPRIEDIGIDSTQLHDDNTADFYLTVSAANIDPNAQVLVNSVVCPSTFYSAIASGFFSTASHRPESYGYPVFHYGMLLVYLPNQNFEQTLTVRVVNADGAFGERQYDIPSRANLDSDGDGLLDDWEINGYPVPDGNGRLISLASMGCNPHRKDVLVQVDWMRSAAPNPDIWPQIDSIFAAAPVLNPDGSQGLNIHIDHGQDVQGDGPFREGGKVLKDFATIDFCSYPNLPNHAVFKDLKEANLAPARTDLFHYCIFGNGRPDGSTGRAEIWGDDFMVTFAATDPDDWANPNAQIGTFVHELGHNLGLFHGGKDRNLEDFHERFKWNQLSSMNYRYQLSGVPIDRAIASSPVTHTYSEGMDTTIDESRVNSKAMATAMRVKPKFPPLTILGMNINAGPVLNGAIENWNPDEKDATDVFINYDEWGSLKLNFRDVHSGRTWVPCSDTDTTVACNKVTLYLSDDRANSCSGFRIRLDGSASIDGGLCAPPRNCGVTFPCVPPGDYLASAVSLCDSNRFYWTNSGTVSNPNDTTDALRLHFEADSVISVRDSLRIL